MLASHTWQSATADLNARGWTTLSGLLTREQCAAVVELFDDPSALFRSHILMARHGFGQGEYKYFAYPLPPLVQQRRTSLYPPLAQVANAWNESLGLQTQFPAE